MAPQIYHTLDTSYRALIRRIREAGQLDQGHKAPYYFYSGAKLTVDLHLAPLLLARKVPWRSLEQELCCWIDEGLVWPDKFKEKGLKFYDGVCKPGQLIPYGRWQWQYENVIKELITNPSSKKIILDIASVWEQSLYYPGCIRSVQFFVHNSTLHAHVYIRSSDVALGLPCDIWQMGQLTRRAQVAVGLERAVLNLYIANAHIYTDHIAGLQQLAERPLKGMRYPEWEPGGYTLDDPDSYQPHPAIPFTFHK